ncbi:MAG: exodeoxyribonuclease VII small subunit [Chitinophagaceae bacterium]
MSEQPDYTTAFRELQEIVAELEKGEVSVDVLSQKVKRAAQLIAVCKLKLTQTELDVQEVLKELDTPE